MTGVGLDSCTHRPRSLTGIISCGTSLQELLLEVCSSHLVGTILNKLEKKIMLLAGKGMSIIYFMEES